MIITFLATLASDKDIMNQINLFRKLDKNSDGYITLRELKSAMKNDIDSEEIESIVKGIDTDQNGAINYTEFIAATMGNQALTDKQRLMKAFKLLDVNGDGELNISDIQKGLHNDEYSLFRSGTIKDILKECDFNENGTVTFDEFYRRLTSTTL